MATLKLFNYEYGNYNDTRVKNITSLASEFPDESAVHIAENVNISFNDGLMTSVIVNIDDNLVENLNYATITNDGIIRPYYVLGYMYQRKGQYQLMLKLDSVLYKLDFIKNAKANIFRGFVDENNQVIYNNEGIDVSKIKVGEVPLRESINDNLNEIDVGYYAVYLDRELGTGSEEANSLAFRIANNEIIADESYPTLADYPFHEYINNRTLFFNLKESHILMNSGRVIKRPRSFYQDSYYDYVPDETVESYKIMKRDDVSDIYDIYNYSNYDISTKVNLNSQRTIEYFLDGRKKTLTYLRADLGTYDDANKMSLTGQGFSRSETGTKKSILGAHISTPFSAKKAGIEAIQYNATPVVTKKTYEQLMAEKDKTINIDGIVYKVKIDTNIRYEDLVWANSNLNITTHLINKYINGSTTEPIANPVLDEVNITIDSYIETEKAPNIDLMTLVYTPDNAIVNHVVETYEVVMTLEQVTQVTTGITLREFGHENEKLNVGPGEEPYKLLIFPYGKLVILYDGGTKEVEVTESIVKNIVSNIIIDYPTAVYDVQKIPYSSVNVDKYFTWTPDGYVSVDLDGGDEDEMLFLDDDGVPYAVFFNAFQTTRQFEIDLSFYLTKGDKKLDATTKFANIVSQSHKSLYQYNYVNNNYGGKFIVSVDLRPYTPFINIDFVAKPGGIYFSSYNDGRGLNIAEDFTITMSTDVFEEYKRNNYNFLNSFNSQQDFQLSILDQQQRHEKSKNELSKEQDWINYGINSASNVVGLATGLGIAAATGGLGAAAGVGMGIKSGMNLITGAATTHLDHIYRDKNLALEQGFAKDKLALTQAQAREQFQMSLENIESRPNRLDKVSGITSLNRRQPYLALYDTTSQEKERLREYFKYNGYNINKIDILANYINFDTPMAYVKAMIIESNKSINNTILQDINQRLSVGIYFMKGN